MGVCPEGFVLRVCPVGVLFVWGFFRILRRRSDVLPKSRKDVSSPIKVTLSFLIPNRLVFFQLYSAL